MSTQRNISDLYVLGKEIGVGTFSKVVLGEEISTKEKVAIKVIDKVSLTGKQKDRLETEIDILSQCKHPNIIRLRDHLQSEKEVYLIMDYKSGGELFDRLITKGYFTEPEACFILKQLGEAIAYLHAKGVVHRDLKPENMLFDNPRDDSPVCIADFGFAKFISGEENLTTPCGTPGYVAPEIANSETYRKAVDMWSFGVVMLCGFPPFYSEDDEELLNSIAQGKFSFPNPYWAAISDTAKNLIIHLLEKDPTKRYTAEQFLAHPWTQGKFIFNKAKQPIKQESQTAQEEKQNKEKSLKISVNKAIDVQRDGAVPIIKSASESTIWKRRMQKGKRNANELSKSQKGLTISINKSEEVEAPKLLDIKK